MLQCKISDMGEVVDDQQGEFSLTIFFLDSTLFATRKHYLQYDNTFSTIYSTYNTILILLIIHHEPYFGCIILISTVAYIIIT